jgi:hypothetical protein
LSGGFALARFDIVPIGAEVPLILGGIGLYIWGCLALAKAKGYSSAIVLTIFLWRSVPGGGAPGPAG